MGWGSVASGRRAWSSHRVCQSHSQWEPPGQWGLSPVLISRLSNCSVRIRPLGRERTRLTFCLFTPIPLSSKYLLGVFIGRHARHCVDKRVEPHLYLATPPSPRVTFLSPGSKLPGPPGLRQAGAAGGGCGGLLQGPVPQPAEGRLLHWLRVLLVRVLL